MTLLPRLSPLDILLLGDVRAAQAQGAGVAVFDMGLNAVLWANGPGRGLVGVPVASFSNGAATRPLQRPVMRQIAAAARVVADRGAGRILLRSGGGIGGRPLVAHLKRMETEAGPVVLLSVDAMRSAAAGDSELALRLLDESGLEDAAIYGDRGLLAGEPAAEEGALNGEIEALIASEAVARDIETEGWMTTLTKVADHLVLVVRQTVEVQVDKDGDRPALPIEEPGSEGVPLGISEPIGGSESETGGEPPSPPAESGRVPAGLFSVKRRRLPAGRPAMNMNALVERWHSRQDERPEDTQPASAAAPDNVQDAEHAKLDGAAGQPIVEGQIIRADASVASESASNLTPSNTAWKSGWDAESLTDLPTADRNSSPRGGMTDTRLEDVTAADGPSAGGAGAPPLLRSRWAVEALAPTPQTIEAPAPDDQAELLIRQAIEGTGLGFTSAEEGASDWSLSAGEAPEAGKAPPEPHAVPNDDPAIVSPQTGQPLDKESVETLPDLPADDAGLLEVPISDDAEVPPGEAFIAPEEPSPAEPEPLPAELLPSERATLGALPAASPLDSDGAAILPAENEPDGGESGEGLVGAPVVSGEVVVASPVFAPRFDSPPVRFVWQIDRDGCFRMLSAAFAEAVGPAAADVIGRSFRDVAQVFGFDAGGEIARLLDRRDTWSGRSILWPVENSDRKVPVDLAALPVYARDRSFDGFRGFGIVKMNEPVEDEEGIGRLLSAAPAQGEGLNRPEDMAEGATPSGAETSAPPNSSRPLLRTFPGEAPAAVFGRRAEPPVSQPSSVEEEPSAIGDDPDYASGDANDRNGDDPAPRIIRLDDRRRPKDGVLSDAEEAAFRAIGMKLGSPAAPDRPAARIATDGALPKTPPFVDGRVPVATETPDVVQADGARPSASPIDEGGGGDQDHTEAGLVSVDTFQAMVGGLPIPLLLASQGDVVFANREFAELTGYEDILTLSDRGGIGALFAERTGEPGDGDVSILRFDGRPVDVRVHLQRVALAGRSHLLMSFLPPLSSPLSLVPRDGAATFPANAAEEDATAPDIGVPTPASEPSENTEAVAIEDLRKQVEELQAVLDTATDGIVLLDPAGTIRAMNGSAHALFGIAQDDHQGRHLSSLFAHESQKATHDYLEMLRDDGLAGILNDGREVIGRVAQGGFIPLFITIGRLSGERGWCVVIRDIAHWKRIEEDLVNARRQAEAASLHKSRFLANISHELRTPLNAIIGFADVMASECFGPIGNERYLEYLGDIKRSGHHVLDLVNDLLDISKIESGKLDLDFEAVSLNEVVQEVVSLMQPQANRERVIVRSNLPATVPPVVADRRTMRQIALNLIANAIRFTPAGGQIIASTTYTAEGDVLLRFRDSGIGMTEREIEIALTPFQQVHAPSVTRGEGTGLGLPLTKAMVEANRAAFAIQSTPGEGTLVEIAFPPQRVLAD